MTQFKLIPYSVRIKKIDSSGYLKIDDLAGDKAELEKTKGKITNYIGERDALSPEETEQLKKNDFFYILQVFLRDRQPTKVFPDHQKTISIIRFVVRNREIYGIIKSGEYGISADFFDVENKVRKDNARNIYDSEEFPFFFHFQIPERGNEGKLILQTVGVFGIATTFERHLNEYLEPIGYSISFNQIISKDFIDQINDDKRLKEIRFIKRVVPKDVADRIHEGAPEDLIEERVFRTTRKKGLNLTSELKMILKNQEIISYEILNEQYTEIKAIVTQSGSRRTMTFGFDKNKLGELLILDKDIPKKDGHPTFETLLSHSEEFLTILAKAMRSE